MMDQSIPLRVPHTPTNRKSVNFQDVHVSGAITIILEVALLLENILPLLVILWWKRPGDRSVSDKIITALCVTFIFSALVPTPLGMVSYFLGSWYGGKSTCECYQVTSTWCSLSSMALVTYMCVDHHQSLCPCPGCKLTVDCRENVGVILMIIYTITLAIATLPVIGLGPEIMRGNDTCDSWILLSPPIGKRQIYFISYLTFGFINIALCTCSSVFILVLLHKPDLADRLKPRQPVDDGVSQLLRSHRGSESPSWLIIALVLLLQVTWIPLLIMITSQKVGVKVSEAAMMYGLLATSLPGLLNPLLYGLLLDSYREAYKKILLKLCICCRPKTQELQELKGVPSSRAVFLAERKRLTKVTIRDYTQAQPKMSSAYNSGFDNDSITELVETHESCQGEGLTCDLDCDTHLDDLDIDCETCMLQKDLYQAGGGMLPNSVRMTSSESSDDFVEVEDFQHAVVGESAI